VTRFVTYYDTQPSGCRRAPPPTADPRGTPAPLTPSAIPTIAGMASVPVWVWANSIFFAVAGWYLWWRLVAQTTTRGTAVRRGGTVFFAVVAVLTPLALLSQFLMPVPFQRAIGWPAWVGYGFVIF